MPRRSLWRGVVAGVSTLEGGPPYPCFHPPVMMKTRGTHLAHTCHPTAQPVCCNGVEEVDGTAAAQVRCHSLSLLLLLPHPQTHHCCFSHPYQTTLASKWPKKGGGELQRQRLVPPSPPPPLPPSLPLAGCNGGGGRGRSGGFEGGSGFSLHPPPS